MIPAFKEWAYIVQALEEGHQIIILRKGGIEETFSADYPEFVLFPTLFHQAHEKVKPEWSQKVKPESYYPDSFTVNIHSFAQLDQAIELESKEQIQALNGLHKWKANVIEERFERWKESQITLLILRVYLFNTPKKTGILPEYGGCKSWIELEENFELSGQPVLNENAFLEQKEHIIEKLEQNKPS